MSRRIADDGQMRAEPERLDEVGLDVLQSWQDGNRTRRDTQRRAAVGVGQGTRQKLVDHGVAQWMLASLPTRIPFCRSVGGLAGSNSGRRLSNKRR